MLTAAPYSSVNFTILYCWIQCLRHIEEQLKDIYNHGKLAALYSQKNGVLETNNYLKESG